MRKRRDCMEYQLTIANDHNVIFTTPEKRWQFKKDAKTLLKFLRYELPSGTFDELRVLIKKEEID